MLGPSDREWKPHAVLGRPLQITARRTCKYQSNTTTCVRCGTTELLHAGGPRKRAKGLYQIRNTKFETHGPLYLEDSVNTEDDTQGTSASSTQRTQIPFHNLKAYNYLKSCHDAVKAVDMERAQEEPFKFFQSSQRLRHLLPHTLPKECLKRVIETRDKIGPCTNVRVAVAYPPQSRHSDTAPGKRHESNLHAVVVGGGTLLEETLGVTQTQQTNWVVPMSAASLELQKKDNLEEDEKTDSSRFHCSSCGNQYIIGTAVQNDRI